MIKRLTADIEKISPGRQKTIKYYQDEQKRLRRLVSDLSSQLEENKNALPRFSEDLKKGRIPALENEGLMQSISHEIRTLVNDISGFTELLTDRELQPDERIHFDEIVKRSSRRLINLVSDAVTLSTIESGQVNMFRQAFNINVLCDTVFKQFVGNAFQKGIVLRFKPALSIEKASVVADEKMVTQIISNLVGNAVKYTERGTVVFGYIVRDNMLKFYVKDTGVGIPIQSQEGLFKIIHPHDRKDENQPCGSGLGLIISRAYAELLGGKIWLTSKPGRGSIFYFTIPFKDK